MEPTAVAGLAGWIISIITAYPIGMSILIGVGTFFVVMTILAPIIVQLTWWTDKDDKLWAIIEKNKYFAMFVKLLGRFSLYIPKK